MACVFVITGPSGVGKGTLIRGLMERVPRLELSVSATTRAPRPGEQDGVDYHFLSSAEFERRVQAGEFVEHADYAARRYGTLRSELEQRVAAGTPVVLEIEVQGARQVRAAMPEAVQVFIAPPSLRRAAHPPSWDAAPTAARRSSVGSPSPSTSCKRARSSRTSSSTTGSRMPSRSSSRSSSPSWAIPDRR